MKKSIFNLFFLLFILAASTGNVWANVAANTRITNNATLSYNDGTATRTSTATVTVTVALVPSAPTVTPGSAMSTQYAGASTTLTNTFTVTATSNGPDTYGVTSAITASTNTSSAAATVQAASASIALGASVTLAGCTTTVIVVPADGTSNSSVNGIQTNSTVVINGETRTVSAVTDNATGTSTITLDAALTTAPAAGVLVAQQKSVLVDVTAGNITTSGTNITVTKNITVTSTNSSTATVTSGTVTDTYTSGLATLNKYVRNVTTPAAGTGSYTYNSTTYYSSGITAKPGEVLEYILVAANGGSGAVTASVVTDAIPTTYVTLQTGVYSSGTRDIAYYDESNGASYYSSASDTDQATFATPTLTVNVGTGATGSAGGSISAGGTVRVLYQVKVNP